MPHFSKTQTSILDVAQEFSQTRGFNGFSYRDIADRIGIRTASIHHHFRTKGDLGAAMTCRYRENFMEAVQRIDACQPNLKQVLSEFSQLFLDTLEEGRMCLCGTLAVEYETLPPPMQAEVRSFFCESERWLESAFRHAQKRGAVAEQDNPEELAAAFMSMLEGAMMSVRALGDTRRFRLVADRFLERFQERAPTP